MRAGLCLAGLIVSLLTISLLAAEKSIDVSAIVPKTEAEKILGEPVQNPTPLNVNSKDGYYSKCNYYGTKSGRSLLLRVRTSRSEEHTSELQSRLHLVCRLLLEKTKRYTQRMLASDDISRT